MKIHLKSAIATLLVLTACAGGDGKSGGSEEGNAYVQTNLAANLPEYRAKFTIPAMVNAWGLAIRPAGAGGHFWVTASGVSYEFVGDVHSSSNPKLTELYQDGLKEVAVPTGGGVATGIVFNEGKQFVINQPVEGAAPISAPAKFITASDGGVVSAWTERAKADGTFDRSHTFDTVFDGSSAGEQYFGVTLNHNFDKLYLANFGANPGIKVLNGAFQPSGIMFDAPFDDNKNGIVDPGEFTPWNIQALTYPDGRKSIFVAYLKTQACPKNSQKEGVCSAGSILPGEEDSYEPEEEGNDPNKGRLAEFDENGKLIAVWGDSKKLNAPWGMAFAPSNYGALSGKLLVGNFGGKGKIAAFDPATKTFVEYMRDAGGDDVAIPGIWGLIFGNGASLGDANALYFGAGPGDEVDGLFGSLRVVE